MEIERLFGKKERNNAERQMEEMGEYEDWRDMGFSGNGWHLSAGRDFFMIAITKKSKTFESSKEAIRKDVTDFDPSISLDFYH